MAIKIEWHRLQNSAEGDRLAFEHFCHHILLRYFRDSGIERKYYNTPGAESYIEIKAPISFQGLSLQPGNVVGWQAKFWLSKRDEGCTPLDEKHRNELVSGFKNANDAKENIKLWILCTPGDFATRSYDTLLKEFSGINDKCTVVSWSKSDFEAFYINEYDKYSGIFHYYFDGQFVGTRYIEEISKDTLEKLKDKYDVELHVASGVERYLKAIVDADIARKNIRQKIEEIIDSVKADKKWNGLLDDKTFKKTRLTKNYIREYNRWIKTIYAFAETIKLCLEAENVLDEVPQLAKHIEQYKSQRDDIVSKIERELRLISENNENEGLPASVAVLIEAHKDRILRIDDNISKDKDERLSLEHLVYLSSRRIHAILAEPGNGKTHLACSLAENLMHPDHVKPVLFLRGSDFRNERTTAQILIEKLNLGSNPSLDEIFDIFDFIGESHKTRFPIIIDGLNEADPHSRLWRSRLPEMERRVQARNHVMLITTSRSHRGYLRTIYECEEASKIPNSYELGRMEMEEVEQMVRKYFKKYDIQPKAYTGLEPFKHPLLLRIFCEVNRGERDLDICDTPLTKCMQEYSKRMIEKIADDTETGSVEKRKYDIKKGLGNVSQTIWDTNERDIRYVPDFYDLFKAEEYAEKIIEEGCFSTEIELDVPYVHYAYDMIAGYHIAQKMVDSYPDKIHFQAYLQQIRPKLFVEPKHTYSEDIKRNLAYLIPQVYHEQWNELQPSEEVSSAMIEVIDAVRTTHGGEQAVQSLIRSTAASVSKEVLCENLYLKACVDKSLSHFADYIPMFAAMQPMEIDQYWNSRYTEYPRLNRMYSTLHDESVTNRYEWEDIISCGIMMCGIMDVEYRERLHKLLFIYTLHHYNEKIEAIYECALRIKDPFIFEAVLSVLTGIALRMNERDKVDAIIQMLERYMEEYSSNSVFLLDALDTLYEYRKHRWGVEYDSSVLKKNQHEKWPIIQGAHIHMYGIYDYDFDKFNLRPLYEPQYRPIIDTPYSRDDIYGMLYTRCVVNGCDEKKCRELDSKAQERPQYRSDHIKPYGYKYGRFAVSELYGWLIVNERLRPAYKHTYRVEFMDIDHSMPSIPEQWQLVNHSIMPENTSVLEKWMEGDDLYVMEEQFIRTLPHHKGEWVMLHGQFSQHVSHKHADYYQAGCVEIDKLSKTNEVIQEGEMTEPHYYDQAYAGEIGWRVLEPREEEWDADEDKRILADYSFSSWSESRYSYRNFICLKTEIARELELRFDVNDMTYYDKDGKEASVYYANETDLFFYLRKDIVERLLEIKQACIRLHIYERRMIDSLPSGIKAPKKTYADRKKDIVYRMPFAQVEKK